MMELTCNFQTSGHKNVLVFDSGNVICEVLDITKVNVNNLPSDLQQHELQISVVGPHLC